MLRCTHFLFYHTTISHSPQVSRRSSEGTAVELAVKHTVCNSRQVSDQATLVYYLHWVCIAPSGSVRAATTSTREGPLEKDFPAAAAAAAARSSLLSAPITGASVPTKTNSVVQPSEQPLPLPEVLPSSPAATKSQKLEFNLNILSQQLLSDPWQRESKKAQVTKEIGPRNSQDLN